MIKEKIINGLIVFLLILPMSFVFPWLYHWIFNSFASNNMVLEKILSVTTMVFFMTILLPSAMNLKKILEVKTKKGKIGNNSKSTG
jgi:hypothetical protein